MEESLSRFREEETVPGIAGLSQVERKRTLTSGENSKARGRDTVAGGGKAGVRDAKALWLQG